MMFVRYRSISTFVIAISPVAIVTMGAGALAFSLESQSTATRRGFFTTMVAAGLSLPSPATADEGYENPNMPGAPEERCEYCPHVAFPRDNDDISCKVN